MAPPAQAATLERKTELMITFPILATTAVVFLILLYGAAWHDEQARPHVIEQRAKRKPRRPQ